MTLGRCGLIPLARYRLRFRAIEGVHLPDYAGSAWRGALGHALKRAVCVTRLDDCKPCLLYRSCAYPYLFETPPPLNSAKMRKYPSAPHPFVLDVAGHSQPLDPGEISELGITLVGRANGELPYLVFAMTQAGERGLGKGQGRLALETVDQETAAGSGEWVSIHVAGGRLEPLPPASGSVPHPPQRVRLVLETPLRIKRDARLVAAADLRFADLFGSLLRRVSMLSYFHTDTPLETDFAGLTAAAREVAFLRTAFTWRDWTRYSSRQKTTMQLGGVVGEALLAGEGLEPFWPYLWIGQYVHAGHNASMGLGRYCLEAASLQAHPMSQSPCDTTEP